MIDNAIKYRLIGAGIMVLSAAALLPLVLDGERPAELDRQVELAKAPEFVVQKIEPVQSLEEITQAPSSTFEESTSDEIQLIPVPKQTNAGNTVTNLIEKPTAKASVVEKPQPAPSVSAPKATPAPAVSTKPAERWTLQIATFKSQENAQRLVAKLKDANYDAYSITVNSLYKVYVGPEFKREVSEKARDQIKKDFRLSGFVIKYSVN
ncbi:SPOR domain-containing protein [Marinomonas dokdonensis]|uniref:SPOR domain-containing protein n=1 Tax=Marinomonas dokdonensis TaxID=328224 RepID=UPI0040556BD6